MNKYFKAIATAMVVFSMLVSTLAIPASVATAQVTGEASASSVVYTECKLTASATTVNSGESVTLTWETKGFTALKINGETVTGDNGSITITNIVKDTTFTLEATNDSGSSCTSHVKVGCDKPITYTEPTPPACPINTKDGRTIVNFNNARNKIFDNRGLSNSQTGLISANMPAGKYDVTLVSWDGYLNRVNVEQSEESYFVSLNLEDGSTVNTNSLPDLADFVIEDTKNQKVNSDLIISSTIKSLQAIHANYPGNGTNSIVSICAAFDKLDEPEEPPVSSCPLTAKDGRIIVDFSNNGDKIFSDWGLDNSRTDLVSANIPAGTYDITLASWDGYLKRINMEQKNETYFTILNLEDGSTLNTGTISDLADFVVEATNVEKVNTALVIPSVIKSLQAKHGFYPGPGANSLVPTCIAFDPIVEDPAPTCDMFTATPGTIMLGATSTLAWETTNATAVFINNGIGSVNVDGTFSVSPLVDTVYKLTAVGTNNKSVDCEVPVKVSEDKVPVCEFFTATPGTLAIGGGNVTLNWKVLNATSVSISPAVGTVALVDSKVVNATASTNFVLTAIDADGDEVTCAAPVVVPDSTPLTCGNNVSFTASDTSIRRGDDTTLTWSTTNVDSVSISGINSTALAGTKTVSPADNTTYVLTATKDNKSVDCPVTVVVTSGGGGGGSATPRCDLEISDTKISRGDSITLKWNTTNATEVTLTDDLGKVIFTTDNKLSSEKKDLFDGELTLKPTRNTEYTLLAERGSRERTCKVEVKMDDLVVLETRDQQPLVAGISLSQVPYTGFEAGPFMTAMFYTLLITWAFYIAYLLVVRKKLANTTGLVSNEVVMNPAGVAAINAAEVNYPNLFASNTAPIAIAPMNLPVEEPVVIGYENAEVVTDVVITNLENQAHTKNALLSSDAMRHLVSTTSEAERAEVLDLVIDEAKKNYPLEDGWVVINESRMKNLCTVCKANAIKAAANTHFAPTVVPEGSSSLAEAIVTGNVVAAYEMIGNRPMFALADAAADLDALYRSRRGGEVTVSDMLVSETTNLSDEKIKRMISALTSALDGTYTDEASAVKMAIMKAVKEVA